MLWYIIELILSVVIIGFPDVSVKLFCHRRSLRLKMKRSGIEVVSLYTSQ